jgi:hypothetical protein
MALSTEATIALFALFVACVPGIWFIVNQKDQIRQWWNRNQGHLSGTPLIHFHPCMSICTEYHWDFGSLQVIANLTVRKITVYCRFQST